MIDLDFWKNKVIELQDECENKQNEIKKLKSDNENLKNEIEELKYILDSKEKIQKCEDVAPSREWLEDRHQQDCITINQLNVTIDVLLDKMERLRNNKSMVLKCLSDFTE